MFTGRKVGRVQPGLPLADGLLTHPHLIGQLLLSPAGVFTQGFHLVWRPAGAALNGRDAVADPFGAKDDQPRRKVDVIHHPLGAEPGLALRGQGVGPPGPRLSSRWRERRLQDVFNFRKRQLASSFLRLRQQVFI